MNHQAAKLVFIEELFARTTNPFLKSFKLLPYYTLDKIIDSFIKKGKFITGSKVLNCEFSIEELENDIEKALKDNILDEVGLLLHFGASKAVISHVTGAQISVIRTKRKLINSEKPKIGRPRDISDDESELIMQMWQSTKGSRAYKLIHIHCHTLISIDDIWFAIHKKPKPRILTVVDVSQQD